MSEKIKKQRAISIMALGTLLIILSFVLVIPSGAIIGDTLFFDDFSSGNSNLWTSNWYTGSITQEVTNTKFHSEPYSYHVVTSDPTGCGARLIKTITDTSTDINIRGFFYISANLVDGQYIELFDFASSSNGNIASVSVKSVSGNLIWRLTNIANYAIINGGIVAQNTWQSVEFSIHKDTTVGTLTLYVNDVLVASLTNQNTAVYTLDRVYAGMAWKSTGTASQVELWMDDIEIATGYIGTNPTPTPTVAPPTPTPIVTPIPTISPTSTPTPIPTNTPTSTVEPTPTVIPTQPPTNYFDETFYNNLRLIGTIILFIGALDFYMQRKIIS